ncbi:MAG: RelA/SpoT family protein [bacterium]
MTIDDLLEIVKKNIPDADLNMIRLAYDFAEEAHRGQKRASGEDYIQHCLYTAKNLAELHLDQTMVIAGLLHDVPEDTSRTINDIKKNFGDDIANLVNGITKLGTIKYRGIERYIENLRKMFVAVAADIRVILVKFADRIHNLQTLYALPHDKQIRIASEVIQIYAPIANRLGMWEIKGQMEDEAFKYLHPKEYAQIKDIIDPYYQKSAAILEEIRTKIDEISKKNNIEIKIIQGRAKHLYKIYKKLEKHDNDINKIYDLIANRIIVNSISDCYAVLGLIHEQWKPLKGRIKDYISQPKPNGYQSLHTTVFGPGGRPIEFQIRTKEMHEEAEYGIAAHWHYDETFHQGEHIKMPDKKLGWVKELTKWKKSLDDNKNFLEDLKLDVFQNRIFVFTPKGDIIDLSEESTPVDFAYHIHTEIGNGCVGAMINNHMASLDTKLKSGDMVEIIVDKHRKKPSRDWLKFVKSNVAKNHIKQATKIKIPFIGKKYLK